MPFLLSVVAGATDVVTFLALSGLFSAHITGNMAILAARLVAGNPAILSALLSVPLFMAVLLVASCAAIVLERSKQPSLRYLLVLQFVLLAGALLAPVALLAGMLAVAAMAVQNALAIGSLKDHPSTAAMTANVTHLMLDLGQIIAGGDASLVEAARNRVLRVLPLVVGFTAGLAIGAWCDAIVGWRALTLAVALAAVAVPLGWKEPSCTARFASS